MLSTAIFVGRNARSTVITPAISACRAGESTSSASASKALEPGVGHVLVGAEHERFGTPRPAGRLLRGSGGQGPSDEGKQEDASGRGQAGKRQGAAPGDG